MFRLSRWFLAARVQHKLLIGYTAVLAASLAVGGLAMEAVVRGALQENGAAARSLIDVARESLWQSYLRASAETVRSVSEIRYSRSLDGELSEAEAREQAMQDLNGLEIAGAVFLQVEGGLNRFVLGSAGAPDAGMMGTAGVDGKSKPGPAGAGTRGTYRCDFEPWGWTITASADREALSRWLANQGLGPAGPSSPDPGRAGLVRARLALAGALAANLILAALTGLSFGALLVRPVRRARLELGGLELPGPELADLKAGFQPRSGDEIESLAKDCIRLARRLEECGRHSGRADDLLQLGSLVPWVAHEIGTPLGIGLTVAGRLERNVREIEELLQLERLERADLARYLDSAGQSAATLRSSLGGAMEIVRNLRRFSASDLAGERSEFDVADRLRQVLSGLAPRLEGSAFRVTVDCPPGLRLDSYPGAFSQIFTNLILNSLIHGFAGRPQGRIRIEARPGPQGLELLYSDDGVGIAPELLPRIFEPFFTTRRGQGGSGLGLHIVYTLVTLSLGGTISADSTPGQGTTFRLRLPVEIVQ